MTQFLISAAHKSSGKTTISIGLCAALSSRGNIVQPFKKGPDFIDPMWLGAAAGRPCHNLDFYLTPGDEIVEAYRTHAAGADVCLVEGNKGLYDGLDLDGSNSNAALARLLNIPVVLVIDVQGMTRGVAPLILGYQAFDPEIRIAGVILNQIRGSRHEDKLRAVIEHYTDVPVIGAVSHEPELAIVERHLGLMPSNENGAAQKKIEAIGRRIAEQVDLHTLRDLGGPIPPPVRPPAAPPHREADIRLGIVRDAAFGFYYPGDLEALERAGASLVPIDSLNDPVLPPIDGLFIGGGFPEVHMAALERNESLRSAIRDAIDAGLPGYAECGGLMYLARSITWGDRTCKMVGIIPSDVIMHDRPVGRGYTRLRETGIGPWPLETADGTLAEFPAHEFHYSSLENLPPDCTFAYTVTRGTGLDGVHDGIMHRNLQANYVHLRDVGNNHWAERFVAFIRRCKESRDAADNG
jgi:cobyrinic acid a,c-diamide synthase